MRDKWCAERMGFVLLSAGARDVGSTTILLQYIDNGGNSILSSFKWPQIFQTLYVSFMSKGDISVLLTYIIIILSGLPPTSATVATAMKNHEVIYTFCALHPTCPYLILI